MRFSKQLQYGLIFVLSMAKNGKITIGKFSSDTGIPVPFLEQIARKLKISGIITSTRGPTGGYELIEGSTVLEVIESLSTSSVLSTNDFFKYRSGETVEERALANFSLNLSSGIMNVIDRQIKNVLNETVANESAPKEIRDMRN